MATENPTPLYRIARWLGWLMLASAVGIGALLWLSRTPECLEPAPTLRGADQFEAPPCMFVDEKTLYIADIETSAGDLEVVLDPAISPQAVNSFVFLAMHDWYDGTFFHRIVRNEEHSYAQGGAAEPDGTGHAGYLTTYEEPSPILRYTRGVMAGLVSGDPRRLGSQFFIVGEDWDEIGPPAAYPIYPPLGRIFDLESLGVLTRIMGSGTEDGAPAQPVFIERVAISVLTGDEEREPFEP